MTYHNSLHAVTRDKAVKELSEYLDLLSSSEIANLYSTMMNSVDTIVVLDEVGMPLRRLIAASDPYHQGEQVDVRDDEFVAEDRTLRQSELDRLAANHSGR